MSSVGNNKQAGYTLTELLVVIAILAMIAAAVTPQIMGRFNTAKIRTAQLQVATVSAALDDFYLDVGRYPSAEESLNALLVAPTGAVGWQGPYVRSRQTLTDPWGGEFQLRSSDEASTPYVLSLGSDGMEGGDGAAGDIASR